MEIKRTKCEMPKEFCKYISFTNSNYYKKEIERLEIKLKSYALSKREKAEARDNLKTTKERLKHCIEVETELNKCDYINLYNNPMELKKIGNLYSDFKNISNGNNNIYYIEPLSLKEKGSWSNRSVETNDFKIKEIIKTKTDLYNSLKEKNYLTDYLVYLYQSFQYSNDGYKEQFVEELKFIDDNYNKNKLSLRDIYQTNLYNDNGLGNKNHKQLNRFCNMSTIEQINTRNALDLGYINFIKNDMEKYYFVETLFGLLEKGFNCISAEYTSKMFEALNEEDKNNLITKLKDDKEIIEYLKLNIDNQDIKIISAIIGVDEEHKRLIVTTDTEYRDEIEEKENVVFLYDDQIKTYLIKNYEFTFDEIKEHYEKIKNCGYSKNNLNFKIEL